MSLAVAYAMKKRKKECHGGKMAEGGMPEDEMPQDAPVTPAMASMAKGMKKAFKAPGYAEGGDVRSTMVQAHDPSKKDETKGVHKQDPGLYNKGKIGGSSKGEHKQVLKEMQGMKGQDRKYLAEGGEVDEMASGYESMPCEKCGHMVGHPVENQGEGEEEDMISHIMKKRKGYSEGGKVSNEDAPVADSEPAEYDDMEKDDDLEFHDTGKNSGDEDGDEQEDEDRHDIVSMIMKSRKKKDKLPHPA